MSRIVPAFGDLFVGERPRWALWLPVFFGTGIALYFALGDEPPRWIGPAALATAAVAMFILGHRLGLQIAGCAAIALVAFAAGFAIAQYRTAIVDAPVLERRTGPVWIAGRILRVDLRGAGSRLLLDRLSIARLGRDRTPERVRVALRGQQPELHPGDEVRVRAVLYPPPGAAAPGAFDFARWAYFERLGAVGYAYGQARLVAAASSSSSWSVAIEIAALRQTITRRILAALPTPSGGIAAALMTGKRGEV